VVYGSVYPTGLPISSVDKDNFQSGRLLTEYLIGHGHRRIAFLMTGGGLPGNNIFLDGISDALTAGGLPPNALVSRMMGNDMEAFQAVTQELLESPDRPTAIITRVSVQVGAVAVAASNAGLRVPDDVEIVFEREDHNQPASGVDPTSYPRVQCKLTPTEIAALIGKILREVSEGVSPRSRRELIPVELHEPDRCRRLETER
jgi:LacI family transcriptional regulator